MKLDTRRAVETPEGVELGLRVAGPVARLTAWFIDALIRGAVYYGIATVAGLFGGAGLAFFLLTVFLGEWFYFVFFEVMRNGATPGKRSCRLHVVHRDGTPVGWTASLIRNFVRFADFFPFAYGFGLVSALVSPEFQRLGDRVAGTVVAYRDAPPGRDEPSQHEPLAPPVALAIDEQAALLEFDERSSNWTTARRKELANLLEPLTGAKGQEGLVRVHGMAAWARRPS
ncbi:MAG: RDD family protein [bacterium]|nr:RDD family protein [bacterium]